MSSRDLMTITPAVAQEFLKKNHCGRPLNSWRVAEYAARMRNGSWFEHGEEQMARDEHGNLIDGQHRNHAVVETGVTLKDVPVVTLDDIDLNR